MTDPTQGQDFFAVPAEQVLDAFQVSPGSGLSEQEARKRLQEKGPNVFRRTKSKSAWRIFVDQFRSMVIIVLVIAGAVAFTFQHIAEGLAIVAVLLVNAGIAFVTEWRAVRSMEALRDMGRDTIRVRREEREIELDADQLVPGDIVIFEGGDLVPADIRLVESNGLQVNESALTGESVPVSKSIEPVSEDTVLAERSCMIYRGTTLTRGSGLGVVVATGMDTELGRISELAEQAEKEATPLQRRLDQLGRRLAWITIGIAICIAVVGLLGGQEPARMIETAIALGVAAIPEGLPIVATLALARGMVIMARRNALINRLPAVETLGATQVIFTDKTGTLTENQMTLRRVITSAGSHTLHEDKDRQKERADGDPWLHRILEIGVLCNNAFIQDEDGDRTAEDEQGDPTETALLRAGLAFGLKREELLRDKPEEREVPFDSQTMMMATVHRTANGLEAAVKGAPSRVLRASGVIVSESSGNDVPMRDKERTQWQEKADELAGQGLRVLAMAEKSVQDVSEDPYTELRFVGLVGLYDPPRTGVENSIDECATAGIKVVMVTGDQPATAAAIARQTGIMGKDDDGVVLGSEIHSPEHMSAQERKRIVKASVFARVSPEQKLRLISLMQEEGMTVAMTGDGVNDAPALKKADIGVAMGRRGTDAAKQVADMVLTDDTFSSIVAAVRHGRIIFGNIRKSVMFMLCTNVAEVLVVAVAAAGGGLLSLPLPLHPLQILYLNVVTDVFPAIALSMGRGEPDIMNRKPRPQNEPVLTRGHWLAIGGWSLLVGTCVLLALAMALHGLGLAQEQAVTVSFLTLAFSKLWFVFNLRSPGSRLLNNDIVVNPAIAGSIVVCTILLLAAVYMPGLSQVLRTAPVGKGGWALLLGMSLVPFVFGQALRSVQSAGNKRDKEIMDMR